MTEGKYSTATLCRCCGEASFFEVTNFGSHPLCFDFSSDRGKRGQTQSYFLGLGQCRSCGVIQLSRPVRSEDLVPRFSWIKNKEPEQHLSDLAQQIAETYGSVLSRVLLVSEFDEKFGAALERKVPVKLVRLELGETSGTHSGQATVQRLVTSYNHQEWPGLIGQFDLIVCCRMLEHAHETRKFIASLKNFLSPTGRLLMEIPESTKSLLQADVAMIWEEHTNYFTHHSIDRFARLNNLAVEKKWVYEYPQEDAVAVLLGAVTTKTDNQSDAAIPLDECRSYVSAIGQAKGAIRGFLEKCRTKRGEIVLFGAGHRAVMFINLFGLEDLISNVIDDDARKQGFSMPGTNIPITSSKHLASSSVGTCLFAIGIESEQKVLLTLTAKYQNRIEYYSISPDSSLAIPTGQRS